MEEAVTLSYNLAQKEDVVLLSPACASFDLFATSALNPDPYTFPGNFDIPQVSKELILSITFDSIDTDWEYFEIPFFEPANNKTQFWIYPYCFDIPLC